MKSLPVTAPRSDSLASDLAELAKVRLSSLVLVTTLVGFLLGWRGPIDYVLLGATLVGTAMCAAGAAALNQWWERDADALMKRTRERPLPARRIHASDALLFGIFLSVGGLAVLGLFANPRATFLAFSTIAIYLFVYTPMKRITSLNTLVGAVPGALPPLIGWVAARGTYDLEGGLLFALMWFWQMPHFLAIAWMYRDDYKLGGFVMLPGSDPAGWATGRQAFLYSLFLLTVSLMPVFFGFNSAWYFYGALLLGAGFAGLAARFLWLRDRESARALFLGSIAYLPLVLGLLVITHR